VHSASLKLYLYLYLFQEYIPDSPAEGGGPTIVVVSLVVEIEGDSTQFEGAGFSLSRTKKCCPVLQATVWSMTVNV